jgi:sterol desaturase/sphingolipid hydroxylase (fatty acid hydroxylase superfamily)
MTSLRALFHSLTDWLRPYPLLHALTMSIGFAVVVYGALGVVFALLEARLQREPGRYRSPHFFNDIIYTLVYQGGVYNILIYAPLFALASPRLGMLRLNALQRLPPLAAFVAYWILADFAAYWIHRLQHTTPILWAFHSVHHTQTRMTYLTSNRNHLIEQFYVNVALLVPALMLGLPAKSWMPLFFAQTFFEHAQHARLRWTYGPLHRLFVSPAFHAMHHSTVEREYNGNYAKIIATWDVLFGTYVRSDAEPARYGVEGMDVPERLTAQFVHPFRMLASSRTVPVAPPLVDTPAPRS